MKKEAAEWSPEKAGIQNRIICEIGASGKFIEGDMFDGGDFDDETEESMEKVVYHLYCSLVSYDTKMGKMFYEKMKVGEYDIKPEDGMIQAILNERAKISGRVAWDVYWFEHFLEDKMIGESSRIANSAFNKDLYIRKKKA